MVIPRAAGCSDPNCLRTRCARSSPFADVLRCVRHRASRGLPEAFLVVRHDANSPVVRWCFLRKALFYFAQAMNFQNNVLKQKSPGGGAGALLTRDATPIRLPEHLKTTRQVLLNTKCSEVRSYDFQTKNGDTLSSPCQELVCHPFHYPLLTGCREAVGCHAIGGGGSIWILGSDHRPHQMILPCHQKN